MAGSPLVKKKAPVPASWQVYSLDPVFSFPRPYSRANSSTLGFALAPHSLCLLRIVSLCTLKLDFGASPGLFRKEVGASSLLLGPYDDLFCCF